MSLGLGGLSKRPIQIPPVTLTVEIPSLPSLHSVFLPPRPPRLHLSLSLSVFISPSSFFNHQPVPKPHNPLSPSPPPLPHPPNPPSWASSPRAWTPSTSAASPSLAAPASKAHPPMTKPQRAARQTLPLLTRTRATFSWLSSLSVRILPSLRRTPELAEVVAGPPRRVLGRWA